MDAIQSLFIKEFINIDELHDVLTYGVVLKPLTEFEKRHAGRKHREIEKSRQEFKDGFFVAFKRNPLSINDFFISQDKHGNLKSMVRTLAFIQYLIERNYQLRPEVISAYDLASSAAPTTTQTAVQSESVRLTKAPQKHGETIKRIAEKEGIDLMQPEAYRNGFRDPTKAQLMALSKLPEKPFNQGWNYLKEHGLRVEARILKK